MKILSSTITPKPHTKRVKAQLVAKPAPRDKHLIKLLRPPSKQGPQTHQKVPTPPSSKAHASKPQVGARAANASAGFVVHQQLVNANQPTHKPMTPSTATSSTPVSMSAEGLSSPSADAKRTVAAEWRRSASEQFAALVSLARQAGSKHDECINLLRSILDVQRQLLECVSPIASAKRSKAAHKTSRAVPPPTAQLPDSLQGIRLLNLKEVATLTGMSRATIYNWMKDPERNFPSQIKYGKRAIRWPADAIEAWLRDGSKQGQAPRSAISIAQGSLVSRAAPQAGSDGGVAATAVGGADQKAH